MFTLTINTDNAAFADDWSELVRILRAVAERIEAGEGWGWDGGRVLDVNGNDVGRWAVSPGSPAH